MTIRAIVSVAPNAPSSGQKSFANPFDLPPAGGRGRARDPRDVGFYLRRNMAVLWGGLCPRAVFGPGSVCGPFRRDVPDRLQLVGRGECAGVGRLCPRLDRRRRAAACRHGRGDEVRGSRTGSAAPTAEITGRGGAVRDPRDPSLLTFGRGSRRARFSGVVKRFGVPVSGFDGIAGIPRPARTWRGGGSCSAVAAPISLHICARSHRGAAGAARFVPPDPAARHRTFPKEAAHA